MRFGAQGIVAWSVTLALLVMVFRDIARRRRTEAELRERADLAAFAADVGAALTKAETLARALTECAEAMVRHLGGATASIWTHNEAENVLELQGSAWAGQPLFGPDGRIPVGEFRIGGIARTRKPALLDVTAGPEREDDKDWAYRAGMVAFAGYPLIVEERLVGVMGLFARKPLTDTTLKALASVADEIALGIDRARASAAVRESEARTRSVVENMIEGLVLLDEKSSIRAVNPAAQRIFGYGAAELVGKSLTLLVPETVGTEPGGFLREAHRRAMGKVTEWEGRRKNGEIFPFELSLFEFRTSEGRWFGGSIRDLTQSREVERMKKEFVSTVSHELRTPLTSIRGSLGLLVGGALGELPPEASELLAVAERNTVRLVALINDILDLERLDTARLEMHFAPVSIAEIFARSIDAVRSYADQEKITLESGATEIEVWGDGDRLVQVLVNLLSNAVKFSPQSSAILLSAAESLDWAEVRVADRGRGVPAAFRDAIFERFRQVEASDSRQKGGTGLGLSICRAIIEKHGGSIGVESEEGKGSTFWFRLPLAGAGREAQDLSSRAVAARPT